MPKSMLRQTLAATAMTTMAGLVMALCPQAAAAKAIACSDGLKTSFKPDAMTTVVAVKVFRKGDPLVVSEPVTDQTPKAGNDLCMVKLVVGPGFPGPKEAPSTSPGIGIEVWLPTAANWNGRLHNIGGLGGFDGGLQGDPAAVGWTHAAEVAGAEGAISASTDAGHTTTRGSWAMAPDGTPARQLWIDYSHRAMHEMAVKTKALAAAFYGRAPRYAYYEGISTGGRHGYRLAQQYPRDYDGIAASLPALNWAQWTTANVYRDLVVERDLEGKALTEGQMDLVSNAAIRACDLVGGKHLGYIVDNSACRYDPTTDRAVLCNGEGNNTTADCVSRRQASAINKMWFGITTDGSVPDPQVDNGVSPRTEGKHRWYGMMRGTSLYNAYFAKRGFRTSAKDGYISDQVALELQNPTLAPPQFVNASGNGKGLWAQMSYEQLGNAFDRSLALDPVFAHVTSDDPDLSAFKAAGGKFVSWHGWNDEAIPVQGTIRYFDKVLATMGGSANVGTFMKFYLVPGAGHGSPNGTANPDAVPPIVAPGQMYALLVDWVEKGIEPANVVLHSPPGSAVQRSAPACAYPLMVTYVGGDPDVAGSYKCS